MLHNCLALQVRRGIFATSSKYLFDWGCFGLDVKKAIREIVGNSGKTHRQLAQDMGKAAPTYVSVIINRGTDPKTSTLAELGNACGYRLALIPDGQRMPKGAIQIDGDRE